MNSLNVSIILLAVMLTVGACSKEGSSELSVSTVEKNMEKTGSELKEDSQKIGSYMDDSAITAKVNAAILAEPGMNVLDINVVTEDGVATLKGTVDSSTIKDNVEVLVASVSGVKRVNNEIDIESAE